MQKFSTHIAATSLPKFVLWRMRPGKGEVSLRLKSGAHIIIRSGTHDNAVADEIFVQHQYFPPRGVELKGIKVIVDIGANVGFASVDLLNRFPQSVATAFEPHPDHTNQIRKHMVLNRLSDRMTLVEAAAGTSAGMVQLLDDGCCSATISNRGEGTTNTDNTITVPIVDIFNALPDGVIDVLKIDAEGAEYDIISDPRFPKVAARTRFLVMEWHNTDLHADGKAWCSERLKDQNFTLYDGSVQHGVAGFIWAVNNTTA